MLANRTIVTSTSIPEESELRRVYSVVNLSDAYSIPLPSSASTDPEILARHIFAQQAPWVSILLALRDTIVSVFGLKTSRALRTLNVDGRATRVGIYRIYQKTQHEVVLGEEDRHLDFRLSVLIANQPDPARGSCLVRPQMDFCRHFLCHLRF